MCEQTNPDMQEVQDRETLRDRLLDIKRQSIALKINLDKIIYTCDTILDNENLLDQDL